MLIKLTITLLLAATGCVGQEQVPDAPLPQLRTRCRTVTLISHNPDMPASLVAEKLHQRDDFNMARLSLTDADTLADVTVSITGDDKNAAVTARRSDGAQLVPSAVPRLRSGRRPSKSHGSSERMLCPSHSTTWPCASRSRAISASSAAW